MRLVVRVRAKLPQSGQLDRRFLDKVGGEGGEGGQGGGRALRGSWLALLRQFITRSVLRSGSLKTLRCSAVPAVGGGSVGNRPCTPAHPYRRSMTRFWPCPCKYFEVVPLCDDVIDIRSTLHWSPATKSLPGSVIFRYRSRIAGSNFKSGVGESREQSES